MPENKSDISVGDLESDGGKLNPMQSGFSRGPPNPPKKKIRAGDFIVRADDPLQPLGNRQEPGHDDAFLQDELLIAQLLSGVAFDSADKVLEMYESTLDDPDAFSSDDFAEVTRDAEDIWQDTMTEAAIATLLLLIAKTVTRGENKISRGIVGDAPSRRRIIEDMTKVVTFRTNQFFTDQVVPALQRQVGKLFETTAAMDPPNLSGIKSILDRRLKSVPYWRVVANASASRAYHYGYLKAAQFQGHTAYRFVAVIDQLTSEICTELDGREWQIADAINLMEQVAGANSIDAVKSIMPWPRFADIKGLDSNALRDIGVMVPPLHGNCRSTIVPV